MTPLPKFESLISDQWVQHRYLKVFSREKTAQSDRLKIAASEDGVRTMLQLAESLGEPFTSLYVLIVPRGGSAEGRYQSPWMNRSELSTLLIRLSNFLEQDGRHHLWLFSDRDKATLVYDQHNVIFAYGPIETYINILKQAGYSETDKLPFPAPHAHQYHASFDEEERQLTQDPKWKHSPLRFGDQWD